MKRRNAIDTENNIAISSDEFHQLKKIAEKGDPEVQFIVALLLSQHAHYDDAEKWARKAAEQGHIQSQFFLCTSLIEIEKPVEAEKWCVRAAKQGNFEAQATLSESYRGDSFFSFKKDTFEAYFWSIIASNPENKDNPYIVFLYDTKAYDRAVILRDELSKSLPTEEVELIQKRAKEWKPVLEIAPKKQD